MFSIRKPSSSTTPKRFATTRPAVAAAGRRPSRRPSGARDAGALRPAARVVIAAIVATRASSWAKPIALRLAMSAAWAAADCAAAFSCARAAAAGPPGAWAESETADAARTSAPSATRGNPTGMAEITRPCPSPFLPRLRGRIREDRSGERSGGQIREHEIREEHPGRSSRAEVAVMAGWRPAARCSRPSRGRPAGSSPRELAATRSASRCASGLAVRSSGAGQEVVGQRQQPRGRGRADAVGEDGQLGAGRQDQLGVAVPAGVDDLPGRAARRHRHAGHGVREVEPGELAGGAGP